MNRLRKLVTSVPSITIIAMMVVYLVLGFLVVPAVLKWQLEKQVAQRGYVLQIEAIRFNPLRLELEVDGLRLTDAKGEAMAGFARMAVDMQWRGIVDGAWTIADARLLSPRLRLALAPDGRSNFSDLIAQFASEPMPDDNTPAQIPRMRVALLAVSDGQVEYFDQTLAQALVTHVTAMTLDLRGLSTLPQERTQYRLGILTSEQESLRLHGEFGLDPLVAQGQLALKQLQVATLARALARQLALQAPTGQVSLAAGFDLAPDDLGRMVGKVQAISLDLADLSLRAPNTDAPLLAAKTLALHDGTVDLAQRDLRFGRFVLRDAAVALALDAKGQGDWMRLMRQEASAKPQQDTPTQPPAAPWRVAVDDAKVDALALAFRDSSRQRSLAIGAVRLAAAPSVQLADGGASATLGPLQLVLGGVSFNDGASDVSAPMVQTDASQSTLQFAGGSLQGKFDAVRLSLAQGVSVRQGDNSASIGASSLEISAVKLDSGQASTGLIADKPRLQLSSVAAAQAAQSVRLDKLVLQGERLSLSARDTSQLQWDALAFDLTGLRMVDTAQDLELALAGFAMAAPSLTLRQDKAGVSAQLKAPDLRLTEARARQVKDAAGLTGLQVGAGTLDVAMRGSAVDLGLAGLKIDARTLTAARATEAVELAQLALGATTLGLALDGNTMRVTGNAARVALVGTRLRQGQDELALKDVSLTVAGLSADRGLASGAVGATNARLQDTVLSLDAVGLARGAGKDAFAKLAGAKVSAGDLALVLSGAPVDLRGDALALSLRGVSLRDPAADASPQLLELGEAGLSGAAFSLPGRSLTADTLVAQDARADLWLDDKGQLNLMELLNRLSGAQRASATPPPVAPTPQPPIAAAQGAPAAPAWRVAVRQIDLKQASAQFADRRQATPFAVGVDDISVQLQALDTGAPDPMQVDLRATLRSGGSLAAKGAVQVSSGAADLQLAIDGVVLAPLQSYLSDYLELTLDSGTASTQGRLVLGAGVGDAPQLAYTGGFSLDKLLLQELAPKRPFLSWTSVRTTDLSLTLEPDQLDIGELQLQGLGGRLIIAPDQSINLTDVLKKREPAPQEPAETATATAPGAAVAKSPVFPVQIARVRLSDGVLDFADLSLRPQFGTRMHQLKGVITGLSTDPERVAKVQLDARVDKFGSARIRGQASVLQPDRLTEIDVAFRNLDMTSLSPYVVKFAGYEIASGKLSLDLQYKVRDSKLLGANKVVLNQMALGKKVESPDALDLPLELALAVLKDADGVIDIGLPVSGDLNDPQFDYGAVIAKAIGNVLGGIVTAPFRALAALFGGGSDAAIDTIDFEPGSAELAPPEQQKIETVARALLARPQLRLKVAPVFAARQDTPVLQSRTVRTEVARTMGLSLTPDEDPGPIDAANPRAAAAIEAAFSARYAPAVLDLLKRRATLVEPSGAVPDAAAAPQSSASASAGASKTVAAPALVAGATTALATPATTPGTTAVTAAPVPTLEPGFHQRLLDRMIAEQAVSAQDLHALAQGRAQVIMARLTDTDGVAADRVALVEIREVTDATDKVVALKLELEAAR